MKKINKFKENVTLSVVIPCFNEQETIRSVIEAITGAGQELAVSYEVILVDNHSNDDSVRIAKEMGALVVFSDANTVSKVRNDGVFHAKGTVLLFLDADVVIDKSWAKRFSEIISTVMDKRVVVGSHCATPLNTKGIFKEWYVQIQEDSRGTHIGSGHMLVNHKLFLELGGFDPDLVSGEDFYFCKKAESKGCRILVDSKLIAYHLGYPTRIADFVRRERWHGQSDVVTRENIFSSKVAIAAIIFGSLHVFMFVSLFLSLEYFICSFAVLFIFCFTVIYYKFRVSSPFSIVRLLPAVYFYLLGRVLAFF